ncbi:Origin recognition complex subunit 2, partial [Serendipita sp. 399]
IEINYGDDFLLALFHLNYAYGWELPSSPLVTYIPDILMGSASSTDDTMPYSCIDYLTSVCQGISSDPLRLIRLLIELIRADINHLPEYRRPKTLLGLLEHAKTHLSLTELRSYSPSCRRLTRYIKESYKQFEKSWLDNDNSYRRVDRTELKTICEEVVTLLNPTEPWEGEETDISWPVHLLRSTGTKDAPFKDEVEKEIESQNVVGDGRGEADQSVHDEQGAREKDVSMTVQDIPSKEVVKNELEPHSLGKGEAEQLTDDEPKAENGATSAIVPTVLPCFTVAVEAQNWLYPRYLRLILMNISPLIRELYGSGVMSTPKPKAVDNASKDTESNAVAINGVTSTIKVYRKYFGPGEVASMGLKQRGNVSEDAQEKTRQMACTFIESVGLRMATADCKKDVSQAALYVSAKLHDTIKKPQDILDVAYTIRYPNSVNAVTGMADIDGERKAEDRKRLLAIERLVLETICFNFTIQMAFPYIIKFARQLGASKDLTKLAWPALLATFEAPSLSPAEETTKAQALVDLFSHAGEWESKYLANIGDLHEICQSILNLLVSASGSISHSYNTSPATPPSPSPYPSPRTPNPFKNLSGGSTAAEQTLLFTSSHFLRLKIALREQHETLKTEGYPFRKREQSKPTIHRPSVTKDDAANATAPSASSKEGEDPANNLVGKNEATMSTVIHVSGRPMKAKATRAKKTPIKPRARSRSVTTTSSRSRASSVVDDEDEDVASSAAPDELVHEQAREIEDDEDPLEEDSVAFDTSDSERDNEGNPVDSPIKKASKSTHGVTKKPRKQPGPPPMETFINQTAFDVYFAHASSRLQISRHILSSLVEPLTNDEVNRVYDQMRTRVEEYVPIRRLHDYHEACFQRYWVELHNGFNLLFHGYGSKRETLMKFGRAWCSKRGHVIVINGFNKGSSFKAIMSAFEKIPGLANAPLSIGGWEGQLSRIYDFFRQSQHQPLYVIIHNIESPTLRDQKTHSVLSTLALHPRIHLIASADHINAGLIWTSNEISSPKHAETPKGGDIPSGRGFSWLFHDLTTFQPYVEEMRSRDITALPSQGQLSSGVVSGQALTEPAMLHILASVTEKAKRLFQLLATRQLAAMDEVSSKQITGTAGLEKYGMQYDLLFNEARKNFIATSDIALRALLGEFIDHEMVKSGGQPEVLWIPASREVVGRVLQNMQSQT